jgi:hypothetical protein
LSREDMDVATRMRSDAEPVDKTVQHLHFRLVNHCRASSFIHHYC